MPNVDKVEFEKRVRTVMEWIIDDYSYSDIVSQVKLKWNVKDRQAKKYIMLAREEWKTNQDEVIERKRAAMIESLKKRKRSLKEQFKGTPAGLNALTAIDRQIIELEGLEPPKKMIHSGENGGPIKSEVTHKVIFENYAQ